MKLQHTAKNLSLYTNTKLQAYIIISEHMQDSKKREQLYSSIYSYKNVTQKNTSPVQLAIRLHLYRQFSSNYFVTIKVNLFPISQIGLLLLQNL